MTGKHAAPVGRNFYRDLITMVVGILVVGAIVYGLLWFISNRESGSTTTTTVAALPATTSAEVEATTTVVTTAQSTTTAGPATTLSVLRDPSQVRVLVLNAVGVVGLAAEVSEELTSMGYQVLTPSNYQPALEQTRVWFVEDFQPEAFELAGVAFPDGLVEENPELTADADIVVILGSSYQG